VAFLSIGWAVAKIRSLMIAEKALSRELGKALAEVQVLEGILPVCAYCKKMRDSDDLWHSMETYIEARSAARFTHGICPDCARKLLAEAGLHEEAAVDAQAKPGAPASAGAN
jgi:hypothetical protein